MPAIRPGTFVRRLKDRIALNRRTFALYSVLRVLVLVVLVRCVMTGRWEDVALCVLSLVLFLIPAFVEDLARSRYPASSRASSTRSSSPQRSWERSTTTTCSSPGGTRCCTP